jgi:hypothetical protein
MAVIKTYMHDAADESSEGSGSNDDDVEELDPTELADLQADQRETFGMVLGGVASSGDGAGAKSKKRRLVVEE